MSEQLYSQFQEQTKLAWWAEKATNGSNSYEYTFFMSDELCPNGLPRGPATGVNDSALI